MFTTSFVNRLQINDVTSFHGSQLKEGQLVFGKVTKLYPNHMAEIVIKGERLTAKLESSLVAGEKYWFKVQKGDELPRLKVLELGKGHEKYPSTVALKELNVQSTKENKLILQFLLKEKLPITKNTFNSATLFLHKIGTDPLSTDLLKFTLSKIEGGSLESVSLKIASLIEKYGLSKENADLIKLILNRQLPLTESVFQALQSLNKGTITDTAQQLLTLLQRENGEAGRNVMTLLTDLFQTNIENRSTNTLEPKVLSEYIKRTIQMLGLNYENKMIQLKQTQVNKEVLKELKPALIQFLQTDPPTGIKESATLLLSKLTAYQLLSAETSFIQQMVFQLPIFMQNKLRDLTIEWNGKKNEKGEIDPNHCRIVFFIELEHIGPVTVDMQIQNRIITLSVVNETNLKEIATPFIEPLKDQLKKLNFTLSTVKFETYKDQQIEEKRNEMFPLSVETNYYEGVDIKI